MRPSARIAALIELVEEVEAGIAKGGLPADAIVNQYFRARRYAGSKDRRAVTEMLYDILRKRELLLWVLSAVSTKLEARPLVIAYLTLYREDDLELFSEAGQFATTALTDEELVFTSAVSDVALSEAPEAIRLNIPAWAVAGITARFGEALGEAANALNVAATVDLRINPLKVEKTFINELIKTSEGFEKSVFSPLGVRSPKNIGLGGIPAYKRGQLEVQDEAAQIASLLVDAQAGMQVADLCAGAGGKSLLVSARMENKGQLYALDTSEKRLTECKKRLDRAGNRNVQLVPLTLAAGERKTALAPMQDKCDRVYVDVPCSGTGTWRRSPDQRWRFTDAKMKDLNETQYGLLVEGAGLVKDGGRLIYMTCSLLPAENEAVVERFLAETKNAWRILDYKDVWPQVMDSDAPQSAATLEGTLQLTPHLHQTDGFYIAIFEKN
ncbi:MAG: RsmB/NOP family class I SAM-dependent RNA methyltransferase [Kordiimonadaceae bacterium]|nr:RsmB/NOP family class I SAM-dependent RNA methyltransferase [Kordiimonadaceae bacterium]